MSYTITFTNGKTLAVIADQSVDEVSTSITLIGKNVNNYGTHLNQNFVGLLENFAGLTEPRAPVTGQTWFDTSEGRLKVYTTGTFRPIGGPTVSNAAPTGAVAGDFWVNKLTKQLKWYDGSNWIGSEKAYSDEDGKNGWVIETYADITNSDVPINVLYRNDFPIAVAVEEEIEFNPVSGFYLFTSTVTTLDPGITLNPALAGVRFIGTATSSDKIEGYTVAQLQQMIATAIIQDDYQLFDTPIDFANDEGISVGTLTNIRIYVTGTTKTSVIAGTIAGEPLEVRYNSVSSGTDAVVFHVDTTNNRLGVFNNAPQYPIDIKGDVNINGNLIVLGTQTTLDVQILRVEDKAIELGYLSTGTYTNAIANGGGIVLKGAVDHTFLYNTSSTSWESSLSLNVLGTGTYKMAGVTVLEADPDNPPYYRLSSNVRSAPALTRLPVLTRLTVTDVLLYGSTVTTVGPLTDLYIEPSSGFINLNTSTKIVGMAQTADGDADDTAITKKYFQDKLALSLGGYDGRKPYTVSLDITGFSNVNDEVIAYLDTLLPVDGFGNQYYAQPDGSRCTVLCHRYQATTQTFALSSLSTSSQQKVINFISTLSYTATSTTTSFINTLTFTSTSIVTDFNLAGAVTVTTPMPSITRTVKLFQVVAGFWTYIEDVDTNYMSSNTPHTISTGTKTFAVNSYNVSFTTSTNVSIRETETQLNYLEGPITAITGTNNQFVTVNVQTAFNSINTSTFTSWIFRLV